MPDPRNLPMDVPEFYGPLSDDALTEIADATLQELDARELEDNCDDNT